jgi:transposase
MTCEHDIPGCEAIKVLEEVQAQHDKLLAENQALIARVDSLSAIDAEKKELKSKNFKLSKALIKEQIEREKAEAERARARASEKELADNVKLKDEQIEALKKIIFDKKSEKIKNRTVNADIKAHEGGTPKTRGKNKDKEIVPGVIKKETQEHRLSDEEKKCSECAKDMNQIGSGKSNVTLEWIPGYFLMKTHVVFSYKCPKCQKILSAMGPLRVGEQMRYGAGFIANVAVSKLADALPFNRLRESLARNGVHIAESTLVSLFAAAARELKPIYTLLMKNIAKCEIVQADETRLKNKELNKNGQVWTFLSKSMIGYVYSNTRSGDIPLSFFGDTTGILVVTSHNH